MKVGTPAVGKVDVVLLHVSVTALMSDSIPKPASTLSRVTEDANLPAVQYTFLTLIIIVS